MNCGDFLIYQSAVKSRFTQGVNWTNRGTFRLKFQSNRFHSISLYINILRLQKWKILRIFVYIPKGIIALSPCIV